MSIEQRLKELNISLPTPPAPLANYAACVEQPLNAAESHVYVSGQLCWKPNGGGLIEGKVGADVSLELGIEAARLAAISALAVLKARLGDLERVRRVVRVECYVACAPEFAEHPKVANGCSDLFADVFGKSVGLHARIAVGVASLPLNAAVEIAALFATARRDADAKSETNA